MACSGESSSTSEDSDVLEREAYDGAVRIYIDPDALPDGVTADAITITELTAADLPDLDGPPPQIALRVGPAGTVFNEPLIVAVELEFDPDSGETPSFTLASGEGGADLEALPIASLVPVGDPETRQFIVTLELPHLSDLYGQVAVVNGVRAAITAPVQDEFPIGQPFTVTAEAEVVGYERYTDASVAHVHPFGNRPARISGNLYVTEGAVRRVTSADSAAPDHTRSVLTQGLRELVEGTGRQSPETTLLSYNHTEVPAGEQRRLTIGLECERTGPFVVVFAAQFRRMSTVQTLGRGSTVRSEQTADWPQGAIARFVGLCVAAPRAPTEMTPTSTPSVAANLVPDGTYEVAATWSEGTGGCGFPAGFTDRLRIVVDGSTIEFNQDSARDTNTGSIDASGNFSVSQESPPEDYNGKMNADGSGTAVNR